MGRNPLTLAYCLSDRHGIPSFNSCKASIVRRTSNDPKFEGILELYHQQGDEKGFSGGRNA